jgi:protein gp37
MAEKTGISWCDATVNFWHGCKKVSEGCKFCYMYRDKDRYNLDGSVVLQTKASTIRKTLKALIEQDYVRKKEGNNEPLKIFTCSWSDFFIDEADGWREEAWQVIREHKQFVWIILTKRIDRVEYCLPPDWGTGWDHVWLCVSAENQERANERIPILLNTPAKVRGVSCEPLIGPIDLMDIDSEEIHGKFIEALTGKVVYGGLAGQDYGPRLDWVIVGGESGNDTGKWKYRPCHVTWIEDIVKQCKEEGVKVFVKQLGTSIAKNMKLKARTGDNIEEFPAELQIQEFPC